MTRSHFVQSPNARYTLLTGATGLLGRYLMRDLLAAGQPVAVLVRPADGEAPTARIDALLSQWARNENASLPRPVVLGGDVSAPGLGLDTAARQWIGRHCARVLHGAAVLRLHGRSRRREPWRTNEGGTQGVLGLCRELGIADLHYVSTAYVAGDRSGEILESELAMGQGFRNDYEESKFRAEQALQAADDIPHRTVYRPSVISGDYETGYTSTYHGLYVYLRILSSVLPRTPPDADGVRRVPYAPDLPRDGRHNIVPVDWVSKAMVHLLGTPSARGHTYHLTPKRPITTQALLDATGSWYGGHPVELCGPNTVDLDAGDFTRSMRMLETYEAYGAGDPSFDRRNLDRFATHLRCPPLDEATVHRYLAYAERDGWGHRSAS